MDFTKKSDFPYLEDNFWTVTLLFFPSNSRDICVYKQSIFKKATNFQNYLSISFFTWHKCFCGVNHRPLIFLPNSMPDREFWLQLPKKTQREIISTAILHLADFIQLLPHQGTDCGKHMVKLCKMKRNTEIRGRIQHLRDGYPWYLAHFFENINFSIISIIFLKIPKSQTYLKHLHCVSLQTLQFWRRTVSVLRFNEMLPRNQINCRDQLLNTNDSNRQSQTEYFTS